MWLWVTRWRRGRREPAGRRGHRDAPGVVAQGGLCGPGVRDHAPARRPSLLAEEEAASDPCRRRRLRYELHPPARRGRGPGDGGTRRLDTAYDDRPARQGVDRTGRLAPEALERTFAACREYAAVIKEHGAERVRFVATSASA